MASDNYHLSVQVNVGSRKPTPDPRAISLSTSAVDLIQFEDSPASSSPLLDQQSSRLSGSRLSGSRSSTSSSSSSSMGPAPRPPSPSPSPPPAHLELVSSLPGSPLKQPPHRPAALTSSSTPDIVRGSSSPVVLPSKPATDATKGLAQGFLWLKKLTSWARYWFVLQADGLFIYYSSRFFSPENRKGAILLTDSHIELSGSALVFVIRTSSAKHTHHKPGKSFHLRSDSPETRQIWVSQLQRFLAGERQFLPGTQRPASVHSVHVDTTPRLFSETLPAGDEKPKKKKSAAPTWVDY